MVDIIERRGKEAFLDSLFVMEEGMRHYFSKAMQAKTNNNTKSDQATEIVAPKIIEIATRGARSQTAIHLLALEELRRANCKPSEVA